MNVHAGFLSHRRKPRFKLPPGSCDAHFPYAPNRRYTPEDAPKVCCTRCTRISASSEP